MVTSSRGKAEHVELPLAQNPSVSAPSCGTSTFKMDGSDRMRS